MLINTSNFKKILLTFPFLTDFSIWCVNNTNMPIKSKRKFFLNPKAGNSEYFLNYSKCKFCKEKLVFANFSDKLLFFPLSFINACVYNYISIITFYNYFYNVLNVYFHNTTPWKLWCLVLKKNFIVKINYIYVSFSSLRMCCVFVAFRWQFNL